jgi:nucleotide-binding universal stress UspA family protein
VKEKLDTFCREETSRLPECPYIVDEIVVETGQPVEAILRHADEPDCDLVVMGSRGQGLVAQVMIGSTSRRVVRRCKKPVLIIRLPED